MFPLLVNVGRESAVGAGRRGMGSQFPNKCPQNTAASDLPQQDYTWKKVNEVLQDLGASVGASTLEGKGYKACQEGLDSAKEKEDHSKADNAKSTEER